MRVWNSYQAVDAIPHRSYDRAQLILCAGRREMGKTAALRRYIDSGEPRVLGFDPFEDFKSLAWPSSDDKQDLPCALEDLEWWERACRRRVKPPIGTDSRSWASKAFAAMVEAADTDADAPPPLRNSLLLLDEITLWSAERHGPALQTLCLQGRRLGLRMAVAAQQISRVPGILLSECTALVIFQMVRPRDLEVLKEWLGPEAARLAPQLGVGECLFAEL